MHFEENSSPPFEIRIKEFDTPQTLLADSTTQFYSMVHASGTVDHKEKGEDAIDSSSSDDEND
mgnify:FL=1